MAITIESVPGVATNSVQDNLWHVASSTNSGETDFKYVFDVWIGGTQKIRVKQYPEPGTSQGYFDAGPIVRNSIIYNWFDPSTPISQSVPANAFDISYDVRYGEEFSGSTTLNLASGTTTAYNWRPDLFKRKIDNPNADYVDKFFTSRRRILYMDLDSNKKFFIPSNSVEIFKVIAYTYSAGEVGSYETPMVGLTIWDLISTISSATGLNYDYYKIIIYQGGINPYIDEILIYSKCNPKYEMIPIHFVNRFGLWETLQFSLVSRLTMDIERKSYERKDYNLIAGEVQYLLGSENNVYQESKINYQNKMNWSYRLTADALSDEDWVWASQLISSPQILMEVDGYFYPVTIKNTNYEYSKYVNNRQRALEVDFEMNQTRYSHLR